MNDQQAHKGTPEPQEPRTAYSARSETLVATYSDLVAIEARLIAMKQRLEAHPPTENRLFNEEEVAQAAVLDDLGTALYRTVAARITAQYRLFRLGRLSPEQP